MRSFEIARKLKDGMLCIDGDANVQPSFPDARLPEYQTKYAAGADFFAAEYVEIPSIWQQLAQALYMKLGEGFRLSDNIDIKPTLVHTGIKANMEDDEVLNLYNRSSGPKKLGLVMANSVGIIDKDYYDNSDNDGEIMFAFYNFKLRRTVIHAGDRIGQGVFMKVLRPTKGLCVKDEIRQGGLGSTGKR